MNPLDEYMMKKEALFGRAGRKAAIMGRSFMRGTLSREAGKGMGKAFMLGVGGAAGAAALGGAQVAGSKILRASHARRDFGDMMEAHPDLRDMQGENPKFFNQAYKSLKRMNPTYAKDPMIAGSYMKKMMASPDTAGLTLAQSFKPPAAVGRPSLTVGGEYGPLSMQF